ncbi:MAG: PilZ domain-containing protein [Thermodesulfobacteriota bacterium]
MGDIERRKQPRIETSNTVSFICLDEDGNEVREGLGTALNLSLGGIKLATREPVETPYVILLVIDLEEEVLEVKGRVAYSRRGDGGTFLTGIQFVDTEEKHHKAIRNFVKTYLRTKRAAKAGSVPKGGPKLG